MEERRVAVIVLVVLAFIVIILTAIVPYIKERMTQTLTFKTCTVHFKYHDGFASDYDIYRSAQNQMALCLCKTYEQRDTATANQVIKIYKECGSPVGIDSIYSTRNVPLDTIIKYKIRAFDTRILVD